MITLEQARGLFSGQTIQIQKRGTWIEAKFLAVDSSGRVWVEEPSDASTHGFEVFTPAVDAVRLMPTRLEGCWGVSIRHHTRDATSEPIACIYAFRDQNAADSWVIRNYGGLVSNDVLEVMTLPPLMMAL